MQDFMPFSKPASAGGEDDDDEGFDESLILSNKW